jgi:hypothetical protein
MVSANGETRGKAPPVTSSSAASRHWRSSVRVAPPNRAPTNRPSGFRARRIWISAPTRSLVQCRARVETARSSVASPNGRRSSSATTRNATARQHPARQVGLDQQADLGAGVAFARALGKSAVSASEVDGDRKLPQDRLQPHHGVLGGAGLQEIGGGSRSRGAARSRRRAVQGAVEEQGGGGHVRGRWRFRATWKAGPRLIARHGVGPEPAGPDPAARAFDGGAALTAGCRPRPSPASPSSTTRSATAAARRSLRLCRGGGAARCVGCQAKPGLQPGRARPASMTSTRAT